MTEKELIEIAANIEAENMEMESEDWYRLCEILLERANG
jgi:hypothetical protein